MLKQEPSFSSTIKVEKPIPNSRPRTKFNEEQLFELERLYQFNSKPLKEMMQELGEKVGLEIRTVQVWFQNRRVKDRVNTSSVKDDGSQAYNGLTSVDSSRFAGLVDHPPSYSPFHTQQGNFPYSTNPQSVVDDRSLLLSVHAQGRTPCPPGAALLINQASTSYTDRPKRAIVQKLNSFTEKLMTPAPWQIERNISMDNKNSNGSFATFNPKSVPNRNMHHNNSIHNGNLDASSYSFDSKTNSFPEFLNNGSFEYNQKFSQLSMNDTNKKHPNHSSHSNSQNTNLYQTSGCCNCPNNTSPPNNIPPSYLTNDKLNNINLSSFDPLFADHFNSTQNSYNSQYNINSSFQNSYNSTYGNNRNFTDQNSFNNQHMNSINPFTMHEINQNSLSSQVQTSMQNFGIQSNVTTNMYNPIANETNFTSNNRMGIDIPQSHHMNANTMNTFLNNSLKNQSPEVASYSSSFGTGAYIHNEIGNPNSGTATMWRNQQHQSFNNGSWY